MYFLSVKRNTDFLRNTLLAPMMISVFQKFYNLQKYIRVIKDIITDFSRFSSYGGFILWHVLGLTVRGAGFAPSFKPAHVISFIKTPYLEKLGKDVRCLSHIGAYFADSKMVERHKT